jgi:hypothetical protein
MSKLTLFRVAALVLAGATAAGAQENPHEKLDRPCESCHGMTSFRDVHFDHEETGFRLEGVHDGVECVQCHVLEDFSRVENDCFSCHEDVHRGALGFDCERCHGVSGWTVFDADAIHEETSFPLLGRHALVDCESCHEGLSTGDLALEASRCVDCHRRDYLETASPNHVGAGFSTDCEECHSAVTWQPGYLADHDGLFFPIYSGRHRGEWDDCSNCHTDPGDYAMFECILCHEHERTAMDGAHLGIPGYEYTSAACYACHPRGEAGEFGEHDALFFPIFSGAHRDRWESCTTCHLDPNTRATFSCLGCHQHDQARMDDKHLGEVPGYAYSSGACYECHPNGRKGN